MFALLRRNEIVLPRVHPPATHPPTWELWAADVQRWTSIGVWSIEPGRPRVLWGMGLSVGEAVVDLCVRHFVRSPRERA